MLDIRHYRLAAVALLFAMYAPAMAAETPAGIVMAVTGTIEPPLSAMTEIPANTPFRVGSGGELTFLHYSRCKLVTVAGGTLTLSLTEYRTDGRVQSEREGPCPRIFTLKDAAGTARSSTGLVMRGGLSPPRWPVHSEFLLTGNRADNVRAAAVYAEDQPDTPLLALQLTGRQATETPGASPILPNSRYVLRLTMIDQPKPLEALFIAAAPSGTGSLVVLRLD